MLTNWNIGDSGPLLLGARAQQKDLHRRLMDMEKANKQLLDMYSSILARHEALTGYIEQQNPTVWNALKQISGRLDHILALIDGSRPSAQASQLAQPVYAYFPPGPLAQNSPQHSNPSSGHF